MGVNLTICLRRYIDTDFDVVTAIWLDSWRSTGIPGAVTLEDLRTRWPVELAKGWIVTVANRGSDIAGFMAIHEDRLEQLFIAPAHQGHRLGKRLLDQAKDQMPAGFRLSTAVDSRAGRFYEREGLIPGVQTTHPRFGHRVIEYRWIGR